MVRIIMSYANAITICIGIIINGSRLQLDDLLATHDLALT